MDAREKRLALNEVLFREINERIEQAAARQGEDSHIFEFLCECSNSDCNLRLPLTVATYETVRRRPDQFLIAPGHELPEIEEIVERTQHYEVVRKQEEAARIAEDHDERHAS